MSFVRQSLALTAGMLLASAGHAETADWSLITAHGEVTITNGETATRAQSGATLPTGATIATGPNGFATLLRDGRKVTLGANSRVRIADPAPTRGLVRLLADAGTISVQGVAAAKPAFAVSTPYLAAVATDASYSVRVTSQGAFVDAEDGAVRVATLDGISTQNVAAGKTLLVRAGAEDGLVVATRQGLEEAAPAPLLAYN